MVAWFRSRGPGPAAGGAPPISRGETDPPELAYRGRMATRKRSAAHAARLTEEETLAALTQWAIARNTIRSCEQAMGSRHSSPRDREELAERADKARADQADARARLGV